MQIELNFWVILAASFIVIGIFSSLLLWFRKERFLALLILTISLWLIDTFFSISGIYSRDANYYFKPIYYSFAFGPLIYFYTKKLTNQRFTIKPKHYLHFIPVLLQGGLYWYLAFQNYEVKNNYWHNWHQPLTYRVEFIGTFVSLAIYILLSLHLLQRFRKWVKDHYSESSQITLNWLRIVLSGFLLLSIFWLFEVVLREVYASYDDYTAMTLAIMTLILAIGGLTQRNTKEFQFESPSHKEVNLDENIVNLLVERMEKHKDYLNPTLTLKEFAQNCKLPSRTISEHINHGLGKNFHDFVNAYRVQEVKNRILANKQSQFTLEAIAYDSGFNSKATFNRIFKKFTGSSPGNFTK